MPNGTFLEPSAVTCTIVRLQTIHLSLHPRRSLRGIQGRPLSDFGSSEPEAFLELFRRQFDILLGPGLTFEFARGGGRGQVVALVVSLWLGTYKGRCRGGQEAEVARKFVESE